MERIWIKEVSVNEHKKRKRRKGEYEKGEQEKRTRKENKKSGGVYEQKVDENMTIGKIERGIEIREETCYLGDVKVLYSTCIE